MKPSTRRWLSTLFIVLTMAIIFIVAFSNNELQNAWEVLFTLRIEWVLAALAGWLGYLLFDGMCLYQFLRKQGHRVSVGYAIFTALEGFYYSNITPGSSGGQPMQIYYMKKRGIPVGVGTSAVSFKFLCTQFMMVAVAGVLWLLNADFVNTQLAGVKWIIIVGMIINGAAVPLMLMLAFCRSVVQSVCNFFIRVGAKLRLIKNRELTEMRMTSTLDAYHSSILAIAKHPWQIALQMLNALLSILCLHSVAICVYHAFGMEGVPWYQVMTVASLLYLSVSYTPLPGASGAQEGGFLVFYKSIFTSGTIGLGLLIWRFFTYYLFLLVGGLVSIITNIRGSKPKAEELEQIEQESAVAALEQLADAPAAEEPAPHKAEEETL